MLFRLKWTWRLYSQYPCYCFWNDFFILIFFMALDSLIMSSHHVFRGDLTLQILELPAEIEPAISRL
jgi:hypothetical protein